MTMLHAFEGLELAIEEVLEMAVPLVSGMAELIGLLIISISLIKTTYHYVRVAILHEQINYHVEMSAGLVTALEFLMAAEVAKTILLPTLETVLLLVATFVSRALMNLLLRAEIRSEQAEHQAEEASKASRLLHLRFRPKERAAEQSKTDKPEG